MIEKLIDVLIDNDWKTWTRDEIRAMLHENVYGCIQLVTNDNDAYPRWNQQRAHRMVAKAFGILSDDSNDVHHACETTNCINPEHLEEKTPADHQKLHGGPRQRHRAKLATGIFKDVLDWLESRGFYVDRKRLMDDWITGKALPNSIPSLQGHNTLATFDIPVVVSEHMPEDHAAIVVTEKQPDGTVVVKDAAIVKGFRRV